MHKNTFFAIAKNVFSAVPAAAPFVDNITNLLQFQAITFTNTGALIRPR